MSNSFVLQLKLFSGQSNHKLMFVSPNYIFTTRGLNFNCSYTVQCLTEGARLYCTYKGGKMPLGEWWELIRVRKWCIGGHPPYLVHMYSISVLQCLTEGVIHWSPVLLYKGGKIIKYHLIVWWMIGSDSLHSFVQLYVYKLNWQAKTGSYGLN